MRRRLTSALARVAEAILRGPGLTVWKPDTRDSSKDLRETASRV